MNTIRKLLAAVALSVLAAPALAQTGPISRLDTANVGGGDVRVYIGGISTGICGASTSAFGYLNVKDTNFNAMYQMLLHARDANRPVTLSTVDVSGACHIYYIQY